MIKKLFFVLFVSSIFFACNRQAAFNYSQDIVKKEQSVGPYLTLTEQKVKGFNEKEQFNSLAMAAGQMEN